MPGRRSRPAPTGSLRSTATRCCRAGATVPDVVGCFDPARYVLLGARDGVVRLRSGELASGTTFEPLDPAKAPRDRFFLIALSRAAAAHPRPP